MVLLAGCGGTQHQATHRCPLTAKQRLAVARALADIHQLRRIEAPLQHYSDRGTPKQERVTGRFLLDVTETSLPVDLEGRLIHQAKAAVGLCGLCFQGLEAQEPVAAGRTAEYSRRDCRTT